MNVSRRDRVTLLTVVLLPLLVWWVGFYPGTFTNDSLSIVNQIRDGTWSNAHTNAYTAFVWFVSAAGSQWALVALAQAVLLAFGISSLGAAVIKSGVPKLLVMIGSGVFALLPQVGAFAVTMWKDVPSSAGALMLAAALLERNVSSNPNSSSLWLAATGALLLGSFRWNGPVALVLLGVFMLVVGRRNSLKLAGIILVVAVGSVGTLLIPQRIGIADSRPWMAIDDRELHDIAYVLHERPEAISTSDKELLSSIMPLGRWKRGGSTCETIDVLLYQHIMQASPHSVKNIEKHQLRLRQIWRRTLRNEPLLVSWARLCRAGGVWSPLYFGEQPTLGLVYLHSNDPELGRPGKFPRLEKELISAVMRTSASETRKALVLNAMLWNLIALVLAMVMRRRPLARRFLLCLPISVSVMMSVMLGAVAHDARYVAGPLLIAQYFVCLVLLDWIWHRVAVSRRLSA